jgi:hypothetical protein
MKKYIFIIALSCFMLAGKTHAAGYDFYVDASSDEATEDGSENLPFKTISAAMAYIKNDDLKKKNILIKNGTYHENITLRNGVNLVGESRDNTIIDGEGNSVAVYFSSTNSDVRNMTVKNANNDFIIDKNSKAHIENCGIRDAGIMGIEVKKASVRKAFQFTLRNSAISGSHKYGAYISRRRIEMTNNHIHENAEEGIDLHEGVKGDIAGNIIEGNGESGIEAILAGTDLAIRGNDIKNNTKQGIAVQAYSSQKGSVLIRRNTIIGNDEYGLRYVNFGKFKANKFKKFMDKHVKLQKNTIGENDKGDFRYE